jgi:hypothetical protein
MTRIFIKGNLDCRFPVSLNTAGHMEAVLKTLGNKGGCVAVKGFALHSLLCTKICVSLGESLVVTSVYLFGIR